MRPRPQRRKYDKSDNVRVNDLVKAPTVRLVDVEGKQLGIVNIDEALKQAADAGYDLVEIAPSAQPPVCKIMDFGKYKYEIAKKTKEGKKKQHTISVKEIRMRPKIDKHDIETKLRHARKFLENGDRVKVSVFFRGREMARIDLGRKILEDFETAIEDIAKIENPITKEGQTLVTVFSKK
ncbi:translation initiation factor IF-3 [candidate division KSB1 bacterium]